MIRGNVPGRLRVVSGLWLSEFIGTGLLRLAGCSVIIFDFGQGSPVAAWLPGMGERRAATGFGFGTVGALIT